MSDDADNTTPEATDTSKPVRPDGGSDKNDDEPLGDLARRIREQREEGARREEGDADTEDGEDSAFYSVDAEGDEEADIGLDDELGGNEDSDELFEEMDISDVDADAVLDSVLTGEPGDEQRGSVTPTVDAATGAEPLDVEVTDDNDYLVPKNKYCESCHFFSSPPEVACSYENTEIVEVVDTTQFRVRNCPVVAGVVSVDGTVLEEGDEGGVLDGTSSD